MKKIYILGVVLSTAMLFSSCDSMLNKEPLDQFTNDNFWSSEKNVQSYANHFYYDFDGYDDDFYFPTLNDNQVSSGFADWSYLTVPASSGNWSNNWTEVRRANVMIQKIPTIKSMTSESKVHWMGVARLMRGWTYFHLVKMYGDVPWINTVLDINDGNVLYGKRIDRDIVMDSVYNDINYACNNMRSSSSRTILSRDVANAIKAEICLYEGTFCKYRSAADGQKPSDLARAKTFLSATKESCLQIMSNDKYNLNPSYQANYNSIDLSGNPEMIFYKPYKLNVMTHGLIEYTCSSTPMSGMSKDAFDSYLFTDGKPLAFTSKDKDDAAFLQKGTKVVAGKTVENDVMNLSQVLATRDIRLSESIDTCLCYKGRTFVRFNVGMAMTSSSGYGVSKFDNSTIPVGNRNTGMKNETDAPLYWLSIVYLEYAEACAELGTVTQSDLDNSINKVKARVGLPPLSINVGFSDPSNNMAVSDLIWEIRRERRCETMYDNNYRYWDLIRWHQLDKLDSSTHPNILLGANVKNDTDVSIPLIGNYINGSNGKNRIYDKKYYLYPIPSGQITLNPQLSQNLGW